MSYFLGQTDSAQALSEPLQAATAHAPGSWGSMMDILVGYILVFAFAFFVTTISTPILRKLAIANGIIDRPNDPRKAHKIPVAYLGGVAVFLGLVAGIAFAALAVVMDFPSLLFYLHSSEEDLFIIPPSILLGMTIIMVTGLIDDVVGLDARLKIVGQLIAAAALALNDFGVRVAEGVIIPFKQYLPTYSVLSDEGVPVDYIGFLLPSMFGMGPIEIDIIYWIGTAIIAVFVLGACNASNLIDGLDGLLSGVTSIAAMGLLIIGLHLASNDDGPQDAARLVLCLSLLGACMGFLPHNFNPASIFLGDCGSLLLGYVTIVVVLSLGDTGSTHLVVAGLIIYAIPIIDTVLAIVRRKMAGKRMSDPDDQHLHHMLKRQYGVKGAVFFIYGLGGIFAILGVWLSNGPVRVVFTIAMVIAAFVAVTAVKAARKNAIDAQAARLYVPEDTKPRAEQTAGSSESRSGGQDSATVATTR